MPGGEHHLDMVALARRAGPGIDRQSEPIRCCCDVGDAATGGDLDRDAVALRPGDQAVELVEEIFAERDAGIEGLFVDAVYANLTAGKQATRGFFLPGISGSAVASASVNYETLTVQFGAAYQVVKVGPDRSAEGPGMAGVGQTAFDVVLGGRWWYQRVDMTLNFFGNVTVNTPNLQLSANRSQVVANSGRVGWVDPLIGFRVRHHLAPGQHINLEADLGGFGIGSRLSAEAQLAYGLEFGNAMGVNWAGVIGYRALYVDYTQGSGSSFFELNQLQHGPLLGVRGRF